MATNKHLTLDDRIKIFQMLEDNQSFKAIAAELGKSPSTISREIRSHIVFEKKGGYGRAYNSCVRRLSCDVRLLCGECVSRRKNAFCRFCGQCNKNCPDYRQESCGSHQKPPYVCNGCPDSIMLSQSTLYRLMDYGLFTAANIDLPLKVRYRARKKKKAHKVDKACRVGRTHADFLAFREANPDVPVVGMDTVEGNKGSAVLLTVHFVESEFMPAFLRGAMTRARSSTP